MRTCLGVLGVAAKISSHGCPITKRLITLRGVVVGHLSLLHVSGTLLAPFLLISLSADFPDNPSPLSSTNAWGHVA